MLVSLHHLARLQFLYCQTGNGGVAIGDGGDANGRGFAINGGQTHLGCSVAVGTMCY
jgi:hypothetical protein